MSRFASLPALRGDWFTVVANIPRDHVADVCIYLEAMDNVALVRTPWRGIGQINIYAWEGVREDVMGAIAELAAEFPFDIVEVAEGMKDIDRLWEQ